MSRKSKGCNAERELIQLFWNAGWAPVRVAGSGSARIPCPDILVSNSKRTLAIEAKAVKGKYLYIRKQQIRDLKKFCLIFGAEPWVGIRFNNKNWLFMGLEHLNETKSNFTAILRVALSTGLKFSDLLGK